MVTFRSPVNPQEPAAPPTCTALSILAGLFVTGGGYPRSLSLEIDRLEATAVALQGRGLTEAAIAHREAAAALRQAVFQNAARVRVEVVRV